MSLFLVVSRILILIFIFGGNIVFYMLCLYRRISPVLQCKCTAVCLNAINPKRTIVPTCPRQIAINIVIDNI
jgi:hypothetical protein